MSSIIFKHIQSTFELDIIYPAEEYCIQHNDLNDITEISICEKKRLHRTLTKRRNQIKN